MIIQVPDKISGKSVEDIADVLYDALIQVHPDAKGFRLDYLILNTTPSQLRREGKKLEVDSKDSFIKAFLQYHNEGKCVIENLQPDLDNQGESILTSGPSELDIYYRTNTQYSNRYYTIAGGVERTSKSFSGFKYHRSLFKKFLVNNRFIKAFREKVLSNYPRIESFLKNILIKSNEYVNEVTANPLYIKIEQRPKTT